MFPNYVRSSGVGECSNASKVQVVEKYDAIQDEHRFSRLLTPLVSHLMKRVQGEQNPRLSHNLNAAGRITGPTSQQLDAIKLCMALRQVSSESKESIMKEITGPVVPIVPDVWGSAVSLHDFFEGAGLAVRKLYRVLKAEDKAIVSFMMNNLNNDDIQAFFSSPTWENFSRKSSVDMAEFDVEVGPLKGRGRGLYLHDQKDIPRMAFYRFSSGHFMMPVFHLLGRLDLNDKNIFTGLVHVNLGIGRNAAAYVQNKPLGSDEAFGVGYLLGGNRGIVSQTDVLGQPVLWSDVILLPDGEVMPGCRGNKSCVDGQGNQREWTNVRFNNNGEITAGSTGGLHATYTSGTKVTWEGDDLRFNEDGSIQDNSRGIQMVMRPNGSFSRWEDVQFSSDGKLLAGTRGNRIVSDGIKGVYQKWQKVTFQPNGMIEPGCKGSVHFITPGFVLAWRGVRLEALGHIQDGSQGDRILRHPNGDFEAWLGVKFRNDGTLVDGCEGRKRRCQKNGLNVVWENTTFGINGSIKPGRGDRIEYYQGGNVQCCYQGVMLDERGNMVEDSDLTFTLKYKDGNIIKFPNVTYKNQSIMRTGENYVGELLAKDGRTGRYNIEDCPLLDTLHLNLSTLDLVFINKREEVKRYSAIMAPAE